VSEKPPPMSPPKSLRRPSKPSGQHPAVQAFRAKAESINDTTLPALVALEERIDRARSTPPKSTEGEWTILIRGPGSLPPTAERLASVLVHALRLAGFGIAQATVTYGSDIRDVSATFPLTGQEHP